MDALEQLYKALAPLGIYSLRSGSRIDGELAAYAAGLELVNEKMRKVLRGVFVQTAENDELLHHEKLVGLAPKTGMTATDRRALIMYRLGVAPFDFTKEGICNCALATGMEIELVEYPGEERMDVRCIGLSDQMLDLDVLKEKVRGVLPAHIECEFDIGEMTWDMFEASGSDWNAWDSKGMTWIEFDINGHEIFR